MVFSSHTSACWRSSLARHCRTRQAGCMGAMTLNWSINNATFGHSLASSLSVSHVDNVSMNLLRWDVLPFVCTSSTQHSLCESVSFIASALLFVVFEFDELVSQDWTTALRFLQSVQWSSQDFSHHFFHSVQFHNKPTCFIVKNRHIFILFAIRHSKLCEKS